jgi:hypothetical protein
VDLSAAGGRIAHLLSVRVLGCGGYRRVKREPHEQLRWEASPEGIRSIVSRQTRVATALVLVVRREPTLRLRRSVRNTVSALVVCNLVALAVVGLVVTAIGLHLDTSVNGLW